MEQQTRRPCGARRDDRHGTRRTARRACRRTGGIGQRGDARDARHELSRDDRAGAGNQRGSDRHAGSGRRSRSSEREVETKTATAARRDAAFTSIRSAAGTSGFGDDGDALAQAHMNLARLVATSVIVSIVLAAAGDARAQARRPDTHKTDPKGDKTDAQKTEAGHLKSAADVLMDQDRPADAIVLYARAYELSNDPALLYNQGRAFEALGDYPAALDKLEAFERDAPPAVRAKVPGLRELIVDLRGRIATLVVRTNAPGARLLVRQKDEGLINTEKRLATRAGAASVEVDADGYETFRRDIELSAGATLVVEANLVSKKRDALVVVRTTPKADIAFDGKALGRSPLQLRTTAGPHELVAQADGYYEERVPMTLALGDRRDVDLEMRSTPGILGKWWFWTGIGAVVLGGVATAIVVTRERPHSNGSFSPGSVSGP